MRKSEEQKIPEKEIVKQKFVRKGTLFMTAETEAIKVQILSTGNAEILLEENDFLIVK